MPWILGSSIVWPISHLKGFDRAALQQEMARPMAALQEQPAGVLRAYVQRLADHQFALELAVLDLVCEMREVLRGVQGQGMA